MNITAMKQALEILESRYAIAPSVWEAAEKASAVLRTAIEEAEKQEHGDADRAYSAGLVEGERLAIEQAPQQDKKSIKQVAAEHGIVMPEHFVPTGLQAVHGAITADPSLAEQPGAAEEEDVYRRQWVGLTDEEREEIAEDYGLELSGYRSAFKEVEAKLREKNA